MRCTPAATPPFDGPGAWAAPSTMQRNLGRPSRSMRCTLSRVTAFGRPPHGTNRSAVGTGWAPPFFPLTSDGVARELGSALSTHTQFGLSRRRLSKTHRFLEP